MSKDEDQGDSSPPDKRLNSTDDTVESKSAPSPPIRYRDDEAALFEAVVRHNALGPLLELTAPERGQVSQTVKDCAEKDYYAPGRTKFSVCPRTVYNWKQRYREGGIDALRPRRRKDQGVSRVLSAEVLERAIQLRKEQPARSTSTLIDILQREKLLGEDVPHRSTFDRHLAQHGASRRQLQVLGQKVTTKLEFEDFGDLWVGDYHHGPPVLGPNGKPTTAKLSAFIDHTTRFPVSDQYYLSEDLATLRDTLLKAFLVWGKPEKIYVDRGSVYRAEQLAYSLSRIGTHLIHSRPYYSQGRGVIEKWWQVAKAFEAEVTQREELLTIHELNRFWESWKELRYCQQIHREIGQSPNEAIQSITPKALAPDMARTLFLVGVTRTVNKKSACVSVEARSFQCPAYLRGKKVKVRYDPNELSSVLISYNDGEFQRIFPQKLNAPQPHPEPIPKQEQTVDYLALLRRDFDKQLLEATRPLAYAELKADPSFDGTLFIKTAVEVAGLKGRASERRELEEFWNIFGPLPESLVRIAIEHAIRLHGRGRHPQIYIHAIRVLAQAEWQNKNSEEPKE